MKTIEIEILNILSRIDDTLEVSLDSDFFSMGFDSIKLIEIAETINDTFGISLDASDLFDYPSVQQLAKYIYDQTFGLTKEEAQAVEAVEPIAIVSAAFRLPGASNFVELEALLASGESVVREMPAKRRQLLGISESQAVGLAGAYIDDIEMFDPQSFRLNAMEAKYIDPQQRLLLSLTKECFANAGIALDQLKDRNIGVFVGASGSDFERTLLQKSTEHRGISATGSASSLTSNRISFSFDFQGPSLTIDTACSSSLVALHMACENLRSNNCQQALVGGVNLLLSPSTTKTLGSAGMLSPKGKITPFDEEASGYMRGEGAAVLLLKPLSKALEDNDPILAVIAASATRHHGRSNGLTAPIPSKQADLIREALMLSGIEAKNIRHFEAHGTGTRLGDQVEIAGITKAFGDEAKHMTLGSIKANIGHLEASAGLAGILKTLTIFRSGKIPPIAQLQKASSQITWPSWLVLPTESLDWVPSEGEAASVSSFGFGGTNAHVILRAAPPLDQLIRRQFLEIPDISPKVRLWPEELERFEVEGLATIQELDSDDIIDLLIADLLDIPRSTLGDDTRMQSDLDMDSIHWFNLAADISQKLDIDFNKSDSVFILNQTVGELKASVKCLISKQKPADALEASSAKILTYLSSDWQSDELVEVIEVTKQDVHQHQEGNVLVETLLRLRDDSSMAIALMKHHKDHAFFYEHSQDHIPGLYLIEAARQASEAFIHANSVDNADSKFILKTQRSTFHSFCNLVDPVFMVIKALSSTESLARDVELRFTFYQNGSEKGFVEGHFSLMNGEVYKALRANKDEPKAAQPARTGYTKSVDAQKRRI